MLNLLEKKNCCGCNACHEICPQKCIEMKEDEEGFIYPTVDKLNCIECGLCEKVCPLKNYYRVKCLENEAYAMYTQKEERIQSSSGGIFGAVASEIIKQGGIICGAAYNNDYEVEHIIAEDEDSLAKIRGSKYAQSSNSGIYVKIKEALKNGRIVLYSGTACQIAGVKKYLGREYDNLYTIDVLCHGVPSPKIWKKYIEQLQKTQKSHISSINLRNKEKGWKGYHVKIDFDNGTTLFEEHHQNIFMKMFLSNICLRPSCHDCKYKSMERPSDLTIGDYWGIENQFPEMDDDKGTSIVKINSAKGKELFELIEKQLRYIKVDLNAALPETADSRKSVKPHPERQKFFEKLDKWSVDKLVRLTKSSFTRKIVRRLKKVQKRIFQ